MGAINQLVDPGEECFFSFDAVPAHTSIIELKDTLGGLVAPNKLNHLRREFMDCHAEELSARMAANELPLCSSEVEMFCVMIYNLVGPMEPISIHNKGRPSAMQTVLVNRLLPGVGLGKSSNSEPIIALQRFIRVLDKCGRMTVPGTLVHIAVTIACVCPPAITPYP